MKLRELRWPHLLAGACILAGLIVSQLGPYPGLDSRALRAAGLLIAIIGLFSTNVLAPTLTSLLFFVLAGLLAVAPSSMIFAGFSSGAIWLVFAGIVLGMAFQRVGLADRVAGRVVDRFGASYAALVIGMTCAGAALGFILPSAMGRTVMLIPVAIALADRMGLGADSKARAGLALAISVGTTIPPMALLPATTPNVLLAGATESVHGIVFRYAPFMALHLPVAGLCSVISVIAVVLWFCRETTPAASEALPRAAWSARERRLAVLLCAMFLLWATDGLHGISPAWVGFGAAVLCLMPGVGVLPGEAMAKDANYGPWFLAAAMVGLGAVANHVGLGAAAAPVLIEAFGFTAGEDAHNFASALALGLVSNAIVTPSGTGVVLPPLASEIAAATGWSVETVSMTVVATFFTSFLPYQSPPIAAGMMLANVPYRIGVRVCLAFSLLYLVVIAPLSFLWWRALGAFAPA